MFNLLIYLLCVHGLSEASAHSEEMTISRALAELAIDTESDKITSAAYEAAKKALIDVIGVTLAGHNAPGVQPVVEQMQDWSGKPEAHVWVYGGKLPVPAATFVNSTMVHALDLDDVHIPSSTHITSVIIPTALAVGEMTHASGKETLAAIVMGIEVAARLGVEYKPRRQHGGFLPTSLMGGFGAAAVTCRLLGLSVDQTIDAYGIFYAQASGNRQALYDRTLAKRIQPAIAARAGVLAGFLAKRGISGPEYIFRTDAGLFRIYGGAKEPPPTVNDIARKRDFYEVERISYKKYTSCGAGHPLIEAAIALVTEHDLKIEDVAKVEIFGVGVNSGMVGVPWKASKNPHVLAQFCAPYEVATAIKNRRMGPAEITNERIRQDKDVAELARRVKLKNPSEFGGKYPGGQTIRIKTTSGRTLVVSRNRDDVFSCDVFSYQDVIDKFKYNASFSGVCPAEKAIAIVKMVNHFETFKDINDFVENYLLFKYGKQ
jgi:2-methylcitrate dehydratase PrpD